MLKYMVEKNKKRRYALITILIMLFIFIQSALPGDLSGRESGMIAAFLAQIFGKGLAEFSLFIRKGAHFTEYALLGISMFLYVREWLKERRETESMIRYAAVWLAGTFYAATDEFHQLFVPGRSGQVSDVLIDSAGVLAGILLTAVILRTGKRRSGEAGAS